MMNHLGTLKKYIIILEAFHSKKILSAYDEDLLGILDISTKQLGRLLKEISEELGNIEILKEGKQIAYKLIEPMDLYVKTFEKNMKIGELFNMIMDGDVSVLDGLERLSQKGSQMYMFKNSIFEDLKDFESNSNFKHIITSIKNREYRKIKFFGSDVIYDNVKCIKVIFMDNNWYCAFVYDKNSLMIGRISFMESVTYASNEQTFNKDSVKEHLKFLQNDMQNGFTLYKNRNKKRIATIKATPIVAKYFDEGMKKFLSSQQFVKKEEDGSVIFTLEYTQSLEVLPFIQRWLPDLIIVEPKELKDEYVTKLNMSIANLLNK